MKYSLSYILTQKFFDRQFALDGNDLAGLTILDGGPDITLEQIEQADLELQAFDYRLKRAPEYPTVEEITLALMDHYEGNNAAVEALAARRAAVKLKYPKN